MIRDEIIKKIKKLLELSSHNSNEQEAFQAALKAQALMAEHDIQEFELANSDEVKEEIKTESSSKDWNQSIMGDLAYTVASNFRCRCYTSHQYVYNQFTGRQNRTSGNTMKFIGYETDAKAAALTFDFLAKILNKNARHRANKAYEEFGTSKGVFNSYALGFIEGVKTVLEKQSKALMLIVPKSVNDEYNAMMFDSHARSARIDNWTFDNQSYNCGVRDGQDAIESHRVDGQLALGN